MRSISTASPAGDDFESRMGAWLTAEGDRRTTFIAILAERTVGMASLFEYRRMPRPGRSDSRWGYVSNMFVLEEFRNQGIGSALLAALLEAADARGYARLVLSPSREALAFYQRAGFIVPDERVAEDRLLVRPGQQEARAEPTAAVLIGESSGPRRNIELKPRDPSPEQSLQTCQRLGADDQGLLWQRDTYFNVSCGRLKLREQRPGRPQLIQYDRPDQAQQRESRYRTVEVTDPAAVRDALTASLGVRSSVTKRRRLLLWRGVRIHLDEVESLGAFIELEAVAQPGSDLTHEHALIRELRRLLSIADERLVPVSYTEQIALSTPEHPS